MIPMTAHGHQPRPRLHFANQLRGLASLLVVSSHLVGVYWLMQGFLELTTLAPAQGGPLPPLVIATTLEWFQPGPFGVGLFFLISGLVVPISLEKHSALSFLVARGLRIYPTYWAGLTLQMLVLAAASHIWGRPIPYDWNTVLANAFLVHDIAGRPSIDLVNWTLTIEVRFYLLVALLASWLRRGNLTAIFGTALIISIVAWLISRNTFGPMILDASTMLYTVSSDLPFIILMLMGILFNYHVHRKIGTPTLVGGLGLMSAMMAFSWWFSVLHGQFTHVLVNDAYALILFSVVYALRRYVRRNRVLDALADISYPLYLIHSTLSFFVMKALMLLFGVSYLLALAAALLAAGLAAAVLHVIIEKPSIRWGRSFGGLSRVAADALSATPGGGLSHE